jgi:thiol:disulfide interchange protein DsbD
VYPLIPITVGVFGASRADSRGRAVLLTSAYVLGMGVVFSVLGVVAALSGKAFGTALGNPLVVVGLAVFMLVLASSMFGAFELALPTGLATRLNGVGGKGLVGALLMGSVSGFIAAPCTGPVLSGVLAYVAKSQNPLLGGALLFVYALGIGVPFFLIGVFTVRLPKSGVWMEWVKSVFGVALVALAASYLRDGFPAVRGFLSSVGAMLGPYGTIGFASALVITGALLGAIHLSFKEDKPQAALKGLGVAALAFAIVLRTAAPSVAEAKDPGALGAAPLAWSMTFNAQQAGSVQPFEAALAKAKADCRPVMIDFFADWCSACKELDKLTYTAPEVALESSRFVNIKVDGTEDHDALTALYERFGVQGLPTVAFINADGEVLESPKVTGWMPPDKFLAQMQRVGRIATCSRTP